MNILNEITCNLNQIKFKYIEWNSNSIEKYWMQIGT